AHLGNAPLLVLPGLEGIFLSRHRTVSYESFAQSPNSTALSASNRRVQRLRSPGALLQATAIKCAWPLTSSLGRGPGRGRSVRAFRFSSTNRRRVRSTVGTLVPTASAISSSLRPSSAFRRIRARVSLRAAVLPLRVSCTSSCRSAAVKATRYFFMGQACSSSPRCSRLYLFSLSAINFNLTDYYVNRVKVDRAGGTCQDAHGSSTVRSRRWRHLLCRKRRLPSLSPKPR